MAKKRFKAKHKKIKAQKAKNINNAKKATEARTGSATYFLDEAKSAYLTGNRDNLKTAYSKLNTDDLSAMKEFIKENSTFAPVAIATDGPMSDAATALSRNKSLVRDSQNKNKNILLGIDDDVSKEITKELKSSVETGESYFNDIKKKLLNADNEIVDYSMYGDIVNEINSDSIPTANKKELEKILGFEDNILIKDNLTDKDITDFTSKTFKGDHTNREQVDQYVKDIRKNFIPSSDEEELVQAMNKRLKKSVENNGYYNNMGKAKQEHIKAKLEKKAKKKEKKTVKVEKKQQKKALGELRRTTGTEGGTIADFVKGQRGSMFNVGVNALFTIGDYKEGLKEGKTHLGAATDAAVSFVGMELLGVWGALGLGAAKGLTTLGVKGAKYAVESSRSMNNIQRFTPFADAQFQDNQQMATMRQSGMELAKMSQYNLQQTLMGTEARNLHR